MSGPGDVTQGPGPEDVTESEAASSEAAPGAAAAPRANRGPGARGGRPPGGRAAGRAVQPARAAAVVVVALAVGIAVLARGGAGGRFDAAVAQKPTTTHVVATTTPPTTVPTTTVPTTTTTTLPPSSVKVLVLNGWKTPHGALFFQKKLEAAGYDTLAPNDATSSDLKTSTILFSNVKYQPNALAIATSLAVPATAVLAETTADESDVPSTLLSDAQVVVLIGEDISNEVPAGYTG